MTTNLICSFLTLVSLLCCTGDTSQVVKKDPLPHLEMSSTVLTLIPEIPSYVPGKPQQDRANAVLNIIYKNNQVELTSIDTIQFVNQGENFESVSCNLCGKTIDIEYWQTATDNAYEQQFKDLAFNTS